MKRFTIAFWVFNGLFAGFMVLGAIPDAISIPEAVELFDRLGYPRYLLPFLGIAKLFGAAAGAPTCSQNHQGVGLRGTHVRPRWRALLRSGDQRPSVVGPVLPLVLLVPAYILYRKRQSPAGLQFQGSIA